MLPFKIITFFKGLSSCLCYELYYFMLPPSFVSVQSHPLALSVPLTVHLCQWSGAQGHEDTDCFMDAFHDTAACFLGAALVIIAGCVPGNPIRAYSVTKLRSPQCPRKAVFFPFSLFPLHGNTQLISFLGQTYNVHLYVHTVSQTIEYIFIMTTS